MIVRGWSDQVHHYVPVDRAYFLDLLARLRMPRQIDDIENKAGKAKAEKNWMKKNADVSDMNHKYVLPIAELHEC